MYRKVFIEKYLEKGFKTDEAKSEIDFALDVLFNYSIKNFYLGEKLNSEQIQQVLDLITIRTETRKPIQQILNVAFFYGKKFYVDENTLIPRPETELLVEKTLELTTKFHNAKILDIGTGSGCIPIVLTLENQNLNVHSVDISDRALDVANKNVKFYNLENKIKLFQSDLFSNIKEKYDIIVSNPPYIPIKEKDSLEKEVKDFDPHLALYAYDDDGIDFYERIIIKAKKFLNSEGFLIFELGINQYKKISDLMLQNGYKNIDIINDYNNIERIIICKNSD